MSFRVSALVAVVGVLAVGSVSPAFGQPIAPPRPRASPFGAIFGPPLPQQQLQQQMILNQGFGVGGVAPGFFGPGLGGPLFGAGPGLGYGSLAYQSAFPGAFGPAAVQVSTGVVGSFGNYGHWYPNLAGGGAGLSGNYGHWYPGGVGVAGGRGGGGGGGAYAGSPVMVGGTGGGVGSRAGSSLLGTGMAAGAAAGQMRR